MKKPCLCRGTSKNKPGTKIFYYVNPKWPPLLPLRIKLWSEKIDGPYYTISCFSYELFMVLAETGFFPCFCQKSFFFSPIQFYYINKTVNRRRLTVRRVLFWPSDRSENATVNCSPYLQVLPKWQSVAGQLAWNKVAHSSSKWPIFRGFDGTYFNSTEGQKNYLVTLPLQV